MGRGKSMGRMDGNSKALGNCPLVGGKKNRERPELGLGIVVDRRLRRLMWG